MNTFDPIWNDERAMNCLRFLQKNNKQVYISLKKNIEAITQMELFGSAERSFLAGDLELHECLVLHENANSNFARYLGITAASSLDATSFFLHVRKDDVTFAVIYAVNADGFIVSKSGIHTDSKITDIKNIFADDLVHCAYTEKYRNETAGVAMSAMPTVRMGVRSC